MELGLKGKNVLISGASKGLGRATALAFAKEGARVGVIARTESELKSLVEEMGGEEKGHFYVVSDLNISDPTQPIKELENKIGNFEVVVHNIGTSLTERNPLSSWDSWKDAIYLNVGIAININNYLAPKMKENKWGRIIHISSISATHLLGNGIYGAAKSFLNDYTKVLGRELAPFGIIVSAIMPGMFKSEGSHWDKVSKSDPDKFKDVIKNHLKIGRMGETDDIVPFILFMASKHSKFAVGSVINVDGGTM